MADDSTEAQRLEREIFHWEQQDPALLYNVIKPGAKGLGANNKGRIHSEEWNHNNAMARSNRVEIQVTNTSTLKVDVFISIRAAAKGINVSHAAIQYALKHNTLILGIYRIERIKKAP